MATPEEQAQIDAWIQQMVQSGGAQAMFSPQNVMAAAQPGIDQEKQVQDWVNQMLQAGGAQAMFSPENVSRTPGGQQAIAERDRSNQLNAQDARFGNDLAWLDPSMSWQANLLGQSAGSQAYADPAAIAAQQQLLGQTGQLANTNLSFMSGDQQQAMMSRLLGVQAPQFAGSGTQQNVLGAALGYMGNQGPGSLNFDNGARQLEQYGNLKDIIAGGGATSIEMANRQKARADSEAWLRGQREADMADYAERGLTGSGMELLNLSADRQAAAGRNSQADLDTAKALEERRLGAINSAAGLATDMRGNTISEQGLLNNRALTGLSSATSLANSMRDADIREQLGLNSALQSQFKGAADIAGTMRTQTANEQIGNRNAIQNALDSGINLADQMRTSSAQEGQYRATSTDRTNQLNQQYINQAASENTAAVQRGYAQMMNNRQQWAINDLNNQANVAIAGKNFDASENYKQASQNERVGAQNTSDWNTAMENLRKALMGASGLSAEQQVQLQQQLGQLGQQYAGWVGGQLDQATTGALNAGGGIGKGGLPSAPETNLSTGGQGGNPYGVSVAGTQTLGNNNQNPYGVSLVY